MPPQSSRATNEHSSKHTLFLTILGLVLTVIGLVALVELFPRPSVSSSSPTVPDLWLTSRFTVSNDGYLQLNDVHAVCFVWKAMTGEGSRLTNSASRVAYPADLTLPPGQAFTVPCEGDVHLVNGPYRSADLAIVVSYRPWPFTFIRQRKFFRFVARLDTGNVIWEKQPSSFLEHDFDSLLNSQSSLYMFKK